MSDVGDALSTSTDALPPGLLTRLRTSPSWQTLSLRSYRFYWLASFFFFVAFGIQRFTFVWLALELTDDNGLAGVAGFAVGLPAFFVTLPAGAYTDRADRRRMLAGTNFTGVIVSLTVAALIWTDLISVEMTIATAIAMGVVIAVAIPPLTAIIPSIVPRAQLLNANGLRTMGQNLGMMLGAVAGGVAIELAGFGGVFALLAAAFAFSVIATLGIYMPPLTPARGPAPSMSTEIREGLRFIYRHDGLRNLIFLMASVGFFMLGPVVVLVPIIARDELAQSAFWAAGLFTFTAIGMLAMSAAFAWIGELHGKGRWMLLSLIFGGLDMILIGWSPWYPLTAFAMFGWGLLGGIQVNLNQTLAQSHTPDEMMGRVMSVVAIALAGLLPLGSLIAGWGAEWIGGGSWMLATGVVVIFVTALNWFRLPALRDMD